MNEKCKFESCGANRQINDFNIAAPYKLSTKDAKGASEAVCDHLGKSDKISSHVVDLGLQE